MLERFGLAVTAGTPSGALLVGSLGQPRRPGIRQPARRARRRVGVPQLVVPRRLRAVLHADSGGREARRQVAHRRRLRSSGRRASAAALVRLAVLLAPAAQSSAILSLAIACSCRRAVRREPLESRLHRHRSRTAWSTVAPRTWRRADGRQDDGQHPAAATCCAAMRPEPSRARRDARRPATAPSAADRRRVARPGDAGHPEPALARPRPRRRGAVAGRGADGGARAARHPAAGLGSGRRSRDVRAAKGRRGARRPARRRADRSESGLRRSAAGWRACSRSACRSAPRAA